MPDEIPDGIGLYRLEDGREVIYTHRVVYPGHCVVEGCTNEALVFCDEHQHEGASSERKKESPL